MMFEILNSNSCKKNSECYDMIRATETENGCVFDD